MVEQTLNVAPSNVPFNPVEDTFVLSTAKADLQKIDIAQVRDAGLKNTETYDWIFSSSGADINGLNTDKIDAMISWIEERGDSSLEGMECSVDIHNLSDYLNSIYNNMDHPCPHCKQYDCTRCPLYRDGYVGCCSEWKAVKEDIANLLYGA